MCPLLSQILGSNPSRRTSAQRRQAGTGNHRERQSRLGSLQYNGAHCHGQSKLIHVMLIDADQLGTHHLMLLQIGGHGVHIPLNLGPEREMKLHGIDAAALGMLLQRSFHILQHSGHIQQSEHVLFI